MSEDHDHGIMAELARLWEEDHEVASQQCGATTCHGPRSQPEGSKRSLPRTLQDTSSPSSDPFLLPGDEQTWEQEDWFLDPATLLAAPKEALHASTAAPCCQALKRRKLPAEILPALGPQGHAAPLSACQAAYNVNTPAQPASCCSFQMPQMHLPSGLLESGAGQSCNHFNEIQGLTQGMHARPSPRPGTPAAGMVGADGIQGHSNPSATSPSWGHTMPGLLPGMPGSVNWSQPPTSGLLPQQLQPGNGLLASMQQQHQQHQANTALLATLQQQQFSSAGPTTQEVPAGTLQLTQHSSLLDVAACGGSTVTTWDAQPVSQSMQSTARLSVPGPARQPPLPQLAPPPTASRARGAAAAAARGAKVESEVASDSDGEGAGGGASAAIACKGSSLHPATYTGSLEDVITLSDQCADDCRMVCQVAGCAKDLAGAKDYHQRYRICDVHIKLPQVLKDGRLQRFCQQCGRFHDLAAFDANRKSCREQLNKHNARRRRRAQIEAQKSKAMEQLSGTVGLVSALACAPGGAGGGGGGGNEPTDGAGGGSGAPAAAVGGGGDASDVGRLLSALMQNPTHLHALRLLLGVQTHAALPVMQPFSPEQAASPAGPTLSVDCAGATGEASGVTGSAAVPEPPSYGLARDVTDGKGVWSPAFESDHRALRISMKLFNRTPADLPPDLRQQVTGWLSSMPAALGGAIRPGCVFLTLHLLMDRPAHADALKRGLSSLLSHLRSRTGCSLWHEGAYAVQLGGEIALVAGGRVTACYLDPTGPLPARPVAVEAATPAGSTPAPRHYPIVTRIAPLCMAAPTKAEGGGIGMIHVTLHGTGLAADGCELIVRQRGTQLRVPLAVASDGTSATAEIPFAVTSTVEDKRTTAAALTSCGVVWLEVARGAWLSPARPLLVLDDPALTAEVAQLQAVDCRAELSAEGLDALLVDLGMVLAHVGATGGGERPVVDCFAGVDHHTVSLKAQRLLLFACDMGWAGVAARVLPLATGSCACAAEMVAAVHASSALPSTALPAAVGSQAPVGSKARGLSLLHRVVRSGNLALLQGVLHWGKVAGYAWRADRNGPGGITPLHLAALQEDPSILLALLDYAPPSAFTCLHAHDGTTPFHLAFQMGHYTLDTLTSLLVDHQLLPSDMLSGSLAAAARGNAKQGALARGGGELVTAAGSQGREADPCGKCHCRLPPLVLSIAAACAACGERVPCLGSLVGKAGRGQTKQSTDGSRVPGHDAARCAGCTTEQQRAAALSAVAVAAAAASVRPDPLRPLSGRKRTLAELSYPVGDASAYERMDRWSADCANNCAGVVDVNNTAPPAAIDVLDACGHRKGSVFSITALCQGCHSNRVLEVM